MNYHYLKTVNPYFSEIKDGNKRFELRLNDRDFKKHDEVYLQEYDAVTKQYSGREVRVTITYVLSDFPGIEKGYCVFAFRVTQHIFKNLKNSVRASTIPLDEKLAKIRKETKSLKIFHPDRPDYIREIR